jgi:uncharacterized membrane protein (Fun14 family)
MALSWNEIKERAARFVKEWTGTTNEDADAKPFLVEFFTVFGISRKKVASFEHRVKKLNEKDGYIDLFWKGVLLVEMKSAGKNLDKAYEQAREYLQKMPQHDLPKYILISDFVNFRLYDLEENITHFFSFSDFVSNVHLFGFLSGYEKKTYKEQDPANIKAAELMGRLHDRLKEIGYEGHPLEVYLVRLLFCLFAEDTTIFQKQQFQDFIEQRTSEDGSDLAARIQELFQVLNTPENKRFKNLDEQLAAFPYVNGKLFEEILPNASFDTKMRQALLDCCYMDWSKISPAIFGSMFQSVMNPQERRNLGAHYTSEKNILKLIKPLFLDELWQEFETIKSNKNKLGEFHRKLAALKFLDPACGCGNFLIITYRELRLLEIEVIRLLQGKQQIIDIDHLVLLNVDQFYGIEYEEFPARIAEVAMYLIDHQMNMLVTAEFGEYLIRLPLRKAATIVHGNALAVDWETVVPKKELNYILGNPPFIGKHLLSDIQIKDMKDVMSSIHSGGLLDYVSGWYVKAAQYIKGTQITAAFVSTNSIVQGEQIGILWNYLFNFFKLKILFAHKTFRWNNEAKGNAAVHVIIIGFANFNRANKRLFEYDNLTGEPHETIVKNINPYLIEGDDVVITPKSKPICSVPQIINGSKPVDGGNLIFTKEEKELFLQIEPKAKQFFRVFAGAEDFIKGKTRWCLWLKDADPDILRTLPNVIERIESVKAFRLKSPKEFTRKKALFPSLFEQIRQPDSDFILIPRVSSENRKYIPLGFLPKDVIVSDTATFIPNSAKFHFGILTSEMHMAWVKTVCGRLKSDFRYSNDIVYNNYPWPENPTEKQTKAIEAAAQKVLDARAEFPESSLADLYDPLTMPPVLVKAHQALDKAVDLAYRPQAFTGEANRMEFLFALYEKYTADLFTEEKQPKSRKAKKKDA